VFAPLGIVLGLIVVAFALCKPEWLSAKLIERKGRN
jgi:formate-dependent nitrite reductase membrane component NrfD